MEGNEGNDTLYGAKDNDTVSGNDGNDVINDDRGNDLLDGNAGNDVVNGGAGDDLLFGAVGADTLTGGAGDDQFLLVAGNGSDLVTDFEDGQDLLVLDGLTFEGNPCVFRPGSSQITYITSLQ